MLQSAQQKIGVFLFRNFAQIFTMSYLSQNSRRGSTLDIPEDAMRNYVALWTKAVNRVIIAKKLTKARWVTNTMSCPRTSAFPFTLTTCIIKTQVSKYLLIWYRNEQRAVWQCRVTGVSTSELHFYMSMRIFRSSFACFEDQLFDSLSEGQNKVYLSRFVFVRHKI